MKIFVTGSTGYIGSAIVEKLIQANHTVVGLARSTDSAQRFVQTAAHFVYGRLDEPELLAGYASDADVTIHAAASRESQGMLWEQNAVNAMLYALQGTGKAFIYTSGISVTGDTSEHVFDESYPVNPANWRAGIEQAVIDAGARQIRGVNIRPAFVYGRAGGIIARLISYARDKGIAGYVQPGTNQWSFVHIDDLASLYTLAAESASAGSVYNAAADVPHAMRAIAESIQRAAGSTSRVEGWSLETATSIVGPIAGLLGMNARVSSAKAQRELGWSPHARNIFDEIERGSYNGA